jgi:formylglycine-generating enzyme required for sulfatase activity
MSAARIAVPTSNSCDSARGREERPVIHIIWYDAQAYGSWLNQRLGLCPGTYRLPSEADGKNACRAGTVTVFSFVDTISPEQAKFDGSNTYGTGRRVEDSGRTVPVGGLPANPWGLCEMHGNVWEWVQDTYGPYPAQVTDASPLVNADASSRVMLRGC